MTAGRAGRMESATSEKPATPGPTGENDPPTSPRQLTRSEGPLRRVTWLLPALTFVVGLLLGAIVVGAVTSGGGGSGTAADSSTPGPGSRGPAATSTPSIGAPGGTTVTVPPACTALAGDARDAANLLEQAATAARDLDAKTLADVARRMQDARDQLTAQANACRGAAPSSSVSSS